MKIQPGTFIDHGTGRKLIALSEAATRLNRHPLSLYDDVKDSGIPLVTVSGCTCIAEDDLGKIREASQ